MGVPKKMGVQGKLRICSTPHILVNTVLADCSIKVKNLKQSTPEKKPVLRFLKCGLPRE